MTHVVRTRNLPYSSDDVKKLIKSCRICAEHKPQFFRPKTGTLIKATQPFERLNIDFKGPLPSKNGNSYILTVIDEYSRFPFAFPCPDISANSVIQCLYSLFAIFGAPAYIHSDRGTSFMSGQLRQFLHERGVATSRTTPYHPQGNAQCERYNGIIWKTIQLATANRKCPISHWEELLPESLYAIRTLLCTATNVTPHERFLPFQRRSSAGTSLPSWLSKPGTVLLRRFVRHNKNDPLTNEVELIEANPHYALVRHSDGKESTVSLRDLAPAGDVPAPNIACKEVPTSQNPSTSAEGQPVGIAPYDSSTDSPQASDTDSIFSLESQNAHSGPDVDDCPTAQKRAHPQTDSEPLFSESQPPARRRRRIFTNSRLREETQPGVSSDQETQGLDSTPNIELPRRSNRTRKKPGRWSDFIPYD